MCGLEADARVALGQPEQDPAWPVSQPNEPPAAPEQRSGASTIVRNRQAASTGRCVQSSAVGEGAFCEVDQVGNQADIRALNGISLPLATAAGAVALGIEFTRRAGTKGADVVENAVIWAAMELQGESGSAMP